MVTVCDTQAMHDSTRAPPSPVPDRARLTAISTDDILWTVSRRAFDAGWEYWSAGAVMDAELTPDGSAIEARVQGSNPLPYDQSISLQRSSGGKLAISGECTCPVGHNCKHVAAALIAFQQQPRTQSPTPATIPEPAQHAPYPGPSWSGLPPPDVDAWLLQLEKAQTPETEEYPSTIRKRLLYVLDQRGTPEQVTLAVTSVELRRDGSLGPHRARHDAHQLARVQTAPKFLRPSDHRIVRRLAVTNPPQEDFVDVLKSIVATGRGRWGAADGPALSLSGPVTGVIDWVVSDDGRQRPRLQIPPPLTALHLATPWYVDPTAGAIGPIEIDQPADVIRVMLAAPWLPPAAASRVRDEIGRRWPDRRLPVPALLAPPELLRAPLQPRLRLLAGDMNVVESGYFSGGQVPEVGGIRRVLPLARLSLRYGSIDFASGDRGDIVTQKGYLVQVARNVLGEAAAAERLQYSGLKPLSRAAYVPPSHPHAHDLLMSDTDPDAWLQFMLEDVPDLRAEGWLVEIDDDFPVRIALPSGELSFELSEGSGIDWFDLDLGVMVDGVRVSLVPALLKVISDPETLLGVMGMISDLEPEVDDEPPPLLLPLPDGRLLAVPFAKLRPILGPLLELFSDSGLDPTASTLRLSRRDAGDLALLEAAGAEAGITWTGGDGVRALGRMLREHGRIPPCAAPPGFGADLRAYQEHGLAWLQFLGSAGLGGVLADDMGLGKTVQALAHLAVEQAAGRLDRPALVICPTSLVANWRAEAARFAPSLRTVILHGPDRAGRFGDIATHDLVITTYPLLARDHAVLTATEWHVVVLDEAQMIKNPQAATSKLARTLQARQRLCLSGTPLENHLGELWSLFDFLMPGFLGDRHGFGRRYRGPIEKNGDVARQAVLARRIAPFLLRRTKQEVAADLPPKTEITEAIDLGAEQRGIYEGIRLAMHARVRDAIRQRGLAGSGIIILDALLKLRQVCCDPRLLKLTSAKVARAGSAKLERLMELLPPMLEDGRRVLLFSQFTSMLALIEAELDRRALPYVRLAGDTRDRATPIRRFQAGEVPLFLISLKAGGTGLNLTAADTVIHYDPWWNPAVEEQATDRAHRIGQDKPVFVHRLITAGTIEEKMEVLKQRKQALASGILDAGQGGGGTMTESDLEMLLSPLAG